MLGEVFWSWIQPTGKQSKAKFSPIVNFCPILLIFNHTYMHIYIFFFFIAFISLIISFVLTLKIRSSYFYPNSFLGSPTITCSLLLWSFTYDDALAHLGCPSSHLLSMPHPLFESLGLKCHSLWHFCIAKIPTYFIWEILFISCNKPLLSSYYVPGTLLCVGGVTKMNNTWSFLLNSEPQSSFSFLAKR